MTQESLKVYLESFSKSNHIQFMFSITQGMFFMKKLVSFIFISALAISLNTQNSFAMKRNIESEEDYENNTQALSIYKSDCNINDLPEEVLVKLFFFFQRWIF